MKFSLEKFNNFVRTNIWVVLLDIIAFLMSYLGTLYLRMCVNGVFKYAEHYVDYFWGYIPYYLVAAFIVFTLFRLYGGIWQYAGLRDLNRIIIANLVTAVLHVVISILVIRAIPAADRMADRMPVSYYIVGAFIQLLFTAGIRFANRFYQEEKRRLHRGKIRVLVV